MPKLRSIRPRVPMAGPPLDRLTTARIERDRELDRDARRRAEPHRRFYHTAEWKQLRAWKLDRQPWCENCARKTPCVRTKADTVHHRRAHRGDWALFCDPSNLESVCASCHSSEIQSGERAGAYVRLVEFGDIAIPANVLSPPVLAPSLVPLFIVCGAPGAGKSTYVAEHRKPGDMVIDVDQIIAEKSGTQARTCASHRYLVDALIERNARLKMLATDPGCARAWLIVTASRGYERERWARKLGARRVVVMLTPAAECIRRINADANRGVDLRAHQVRAAQDWWDCFSDCSIDEAVMPGSGAAVGYGV
jgi:predicted kinase